MASLSLKGGKTTVCVECGYELGPEFFGTYGTRRGRRQHWKCIPCRIPFDTSRSPGAGRLKCAICSRPLSKHGIGEWCLYRQEKR